MFLIMTKIFDKNFFYLLLVRKLFMRTLNLFSLLEISSYHFQFLLILTEISVTTFTCFLGATKVSATRLSFCYGVGNWHQNVQNFFVIMTELSRKMFTDFLLMNKMSYQLIGIFFTVLNFL